MKKNRDAMQECIATVGMKRTVVLIFGEHREEMNTNQACRDHVRADLSKGPVGVEKHLDACKKGCGAKLFEEEAAIILAKMSPNASAISQLIPARA